MLPKKLKNLLNGLKSSPYRVYEVNYYDRLDTLLADFYGQDKSLVYYKIFCFLNGIIYPFQEVESGTLLRVYDIDSFIPIFEKNDINIANYIFK